MKNIPFHFFLVVPAFIFFLYVHNFHVTTFRSTLRSYEVALMVSAGIFLISYASLKKDKHKAGAVTIFLMLVLFFYGFLYDVAEKLFYKGWWPFSEIHRYLLIAIFSCTGLLWYFLFRTKRTFKSLTFSLNVFVVVLFAINFFRLTTSLGKAENKFNVGPEKKILPFRDSLPDIYYIILDGYANDSMLSEVYHYPHNSLTNYLAEKKFLIASGSRTNYISTFPSLASSLNYSYIDSLLEEIQNKKNFIYENRVSAYLKNKGYEIVHVRSGFSVTRENYFADTIIALNNLSEFERTLLRYTALRLDDLFGYARYKTLKEQLSVMYDVFKVKSPKYVFVHIVSPHPPYVCDENGKFKTSKRVVNIWWEPKEDYLQQLKYINKEIINFTSEIFRQSKINPILIIQSDHGPWIQSNSFQTIYNTRSMILNAYYIPYGWKKNIYSSITPVNSFRIIFNGLFNDSLSILKDVPLDSMYVKNNMNSNLVIRE